MPYKTVLFDAFGTLLQISNGAHPYRQILKAGIRQGRRPTPDDLHALLTQTLDLQQAADYFGVKIEPDHMAEIQQALDAELANIQAFEDGLRAVEILQREGVRVAVCSNLAAPYAAPLKRLYPNLDAYGFSFELGMMKPNKLIYRTTCELAGARADDYFGSDRVLMIGDSPKCDKAGARAAGVRGFLLNRTGAGDFKSLVEFAEAVLEENSKEM